MPTFKTLITLIATAGIASGSVAFAQEVDPYQEIEPVTETDYFSGADADANGLLARDEFMAYVNARADAGDEDYVAIREGGNLETLFTINDTNTDGYLDRSELEPS